MRREPRLPIHLVRLEKSFGHSFVTAPFSSHVVKGLSGLARVQQTTMLSNSLLVIVCVARGQPSPAALNRTLPRTLFTGQVSASRHTDGPLPRDPMRILSPFRSFKLAHWALPLALLAAEGGAFYSWACRQDCCRYWGSPLVVPRFASVCLEALKEGLKQLRLSTCSVLSVGTVSGLLRGNSARNRSSTRLLAGEPLFRNLQA